MVFPIAKLGYLALKQIGKPIARLLKDKAKTRPFLRNYVCMPPAQFYHWMEVKFKMQLMGLGKPTDVKPLSDEMAVELGAEMLGEVIIFTMGAAIIYLEYRRQANNEQRKEDNQNDKLVELDAKVTDLAVMTEQQDARIRELVRLVESMHGRSIPGNIAGEDKSLSRKIIGAMTGPVENSPKVAT